jgi:hypothetical protein
MKREPQSAAKSRRIRARSNPLFFNKSKSPSDDFLSGRIAPNPGFAQTRSAQQSNQLVASAAHRPASRPGAD